MRQLSTASLASLFLIVIIALSSCGGSSLELDTEVAPRLQPVDMDREDLLKSIRSWNDAAIDPLLADELRSSLISMVESDPRLRWTSAAPSGSINRTSDLVISSDGSGGKLLRWTYRNRGDYDLNSEVNVSDITALGANLGKTSASPDWNEKGRYADGDDNGEVNIADVTPIGSSLFSQVGSYRVLGSTGGAEELTELGTVLFENGDPRAMFGYSFLLPEGEYKLFAVEPLDSQGSAGVRSNFAGSGVVLDMLPGEPADNAAGAVPNLTVPPGDPAHVSIDDRPAGTQMQTSRTRLLVSFSPQASVGDVNALLATHQASIIGGIPSINLTVLEIPETSDFTALQALLDEFAGSGLADIITQDVAIETLNTDSPSTAQDPTLSPYSQDNPMGVAPNPWLWNVPPSTNAQTDGNWGLEAMRVPQMWNLLDHARRGSALPVTVVLDAGFNDTNMDGIDDHPTGEMAHIRHYKFSMDDNDYTPDATPGAHGEHVAGIVGALHGNNVGVCGVNPLVERVSGDAQQQFYGISTRNQGSTFAALFASIVSDMHDILGSSTIPAPDVMNMSLGYNVKANLQVDGNLDQQVKQLAAEQGLWVRRLMKNHPDTLIIAAAGNDSQNLAPGVEELHCKWSSPWAAAATATDVPGLPKSPNILIVEALDAIPANPSAAFTSWNYTKSLFSNVGGHVAAPGGRIMSTIGINLASYTNYDTFDGTSMASPHVAGLASFLLNLEPTLSVSDLRELLTGASSIHPSVRASGEEPLPPGVTGPAARVDAFAAAIGIDSLRGNRKLQNALVDVDDGSIDGNMRVDPFSSAELSTVDTADSRRGDGRITMRDFRAFRDAYLQVHAADFSGGVKLDGSATHFKRDLNFDGAVDMAAVNPVHPVDVTVATNPGNAPGENVYPRYDFNGDGEIGGWSRTAPFRVGLDQQGAVTTDFQPVAAPGLLRDIDVLATADWSKEDQLGGQVYNENVAVDPAEEGVDSPGAFWQPALSLLGNRDAGTNAPSELKAMPDYLHSFDLHLQVDFSEVPAEVGELTVTVRAEIWPDGVDNNGEDGTDEDFEMSLDRTAHISRDTPMPLILTMPLWTGNARIQWEGDGGASFGGSRTLDKLKVGEDRKLVIPSQEWRTVDFSDVGEPALSGYPTSAVINGHAAFIATYLPQPGQGDVMFSIASDTKATDWEDAVLVTKSYNFHIDLCEVGGVPAVAHYDDWTLGNPMNLIFIRGSDPMGKSWMSPTTVAHLPDAEDEYFEDLNLSEVDGRPAVTYVRHDNTPFAPKPEVLEYRIAADPEGSSWGAAVAMPAMAAYYLYGFEESDNKPMILIASLLAFGDEGVTETRLLSGSSSAGGFGNLAVPGNPTPYGFSIVEGNPALVGSIGPTNNADWFYMRSADQQGANWDLSVSVPDQSRSLAVIAGRPTLVIGTGSEIQYLRAKDEQGTQWSDPTVVSTGSSILVTGLEEVDGRPAIFFKSNNMYQFSILE